MGSQNEMFHYSFSASEQQEIERIRKKYIEETKKENVNKLKTVKALDKSVTNKASAWSLCVGIFFALIMGFGMSLVMTDLGEKLGISSHLILGIVIGIIGMVGVIVAYPLYQFVLKRERKKVAPQILKLTDELVK